MECSSRFEKFLNDRNNRDIDTFHHEWWILNDYIWKFEWLNTDKLNILQDFIWYLSENWIDNKEHDEILNAIRILKERVQIETVDWLMCVFEWNYFDFIDNWLTSELKQIVNNYKDKISLVKIENDKLYNWIEFLLRLFADIETSWRNIKNSDWSSASGYFQFLTKWDKWYEILVNWEFEEINIEQFKDLMKKYPDWKWKLWDKEFTSTNVRYKRSSYELALYRVKKYYWNNIPEWIWNIEIKGNWKTSHNPMLLTPEQQSIVFLINLFEDDRVVSDDQWNLFTVKDLLPKVIKGDETSVRLLYCLFHHTDPDKKTLNRIKKILQKYKWEMLALNN